MGLRSLLALMALALGACDSSDPAQTAPGGTRAEGEVLGGTISDDMIPLDDLRSQSPPLRPAAGSATAGADDGDGSPDAGEGAPDDAAAEDSGTADAEPAPADDEPTGED